MIKNPTVQSDLSWKNIRTHLNHHLHSIYLIEEVQHCHICELNMKDENIVRSYTDT